jgi:aspartate-semialdehyde dehydrogenase
LEQAFGPIDKIFVTTLQAISGAGYPGVASLDIFDNVVPEISGEEDKLETEVGKILGVGESCRITSREDIAISACCNRVPVLGMVVLFDYRWTYRMCIAFIQKRTGTER